MATKADVVNYLPILRNFVSESQMSALGDLCYGEERHFFIEKLVDLGRTISAMPKTGETDGQGDDAIVHLHYFLGNMDWFITEKDMILDEQYQAFGLADLGMGYPELGYISIEEITAAGAELDLYWTPKSLREVKEERS